MLRSIPGLHNLALALALSGPMSLQAAGTLPNGLYPSGSCEGRAAHYATKGWVAPIFPTEKRDYFFPKAPQHLTQQSESWPLLWSGSKDSWAQIQPDGRKGILILGFPTNQSYRPAPALFSFSPFLPEPHRFLSIRNRVTGLALNDTNEAIALSSGVYAQSDDANVRDGARVVILDRMALQNNFQDAPLGPSGDGLQLIENSSVLADITIQGSMAHGSALAPEGEAFFTSPLELRFSPDGKYLVARNHRELEIFRFQKNKICRLQHSIAYPKMNDEFTAKHMIFSSESTILRFIAWNRDHRVREAFDLSLDDLHCVK